VLVIPSIHFIFATLKYFVKTQKAFLNQPLAKILLGEVDESAGVLDDICTQPKSWKDRVVGPAQEKLKLHPFQPFNILFYKSVMWK